MTYARNNYKPVPVEDKTIDEYLTNYYVQSRDNGKDPRSFEAINRFAGAISKLKLNDTITQTEYDKAIELQDYSIKSLGMDPTNVDMEDVRGNTGSNKEKTHRTHIINIMHEYINNPNNLDVDAIPKKVLLQMVQDKYNMGKQTFYTAYNQLKDGNVIYEYYKQVYFKK